MAKQKEQLSKTEVRYFDGPQLRKDPEGNYTRTVEGYALKFNTLSVLLYGWFKERIDPGSLADIDLVASDIVALFNHDRNLILARTISNTLQLSVDDIGLRYEFEAPNTTAGNDLLESLKRGDVQHSSFAFEVAPGGDAWTFDADGTEIRTIKKFQAINDVSPVVNPAYLDTEANVAKRSYEEWKKESRTDNDDDDKTDGGGSGDEPTKQQQEIEAAACARSRELDLLKLK